VSSLGDLGLCSVPFEDALADLDLALIVTAHPGVDHELIASRAPAVLDLRGVLSGVWASHVARL
jgi:UDP-N-acetyl-D-glucosamine dehydrogenase